MKTVTVDERRVLHRLVYRTLPEITGQGSKLPQHVLKFEMELSCPPSTSTHATQCLENARKPKDVLSSDESNSSADPHSAQASTSQPGSLSGTLNNGWDSSCQVGREAYVNLMLPDRSAFHLWMFNSLTSCHSAQWICSFVFSIGMILL